MAYILLLSHGENEAKKSFGCPTILENKFCSVTIKKKP